MKGVLFTFFFFAFALTAKSQTQNLWLDDDRLPIPTFDNQGIKPNTVVNIYKSDFVMDNMLNSGSSEEKHYATVQFDDRSRPVHIIVSTPDKEFTFLKTVFNYESDDTFNATLFKGNNHLFHTWQIEDSLLIEEATYTDGRAHYKWKYHKDLDGTIYDEKFKWSDKLIRVAIMKQDSIDADARYLVLEKGKLNKMSLYKFNEDGNPKRVELLNTGDLNKAAKKLNVHRNELREFDAERIRMALTGLTYYWNFEYDENNHLVKQILFDEHSQEVGMVQYKRDANGKLESVIADADIASKTPWYSFYNDLSGLSESKSVYYYQGLELLNVKNQTIYDFSGRPVESVFEYVGYNVGGHREKYRYEYFPK